MSEVKGVRRMRSELTGKTNGTAVAAWRVTRRRLPVGVLALAVGALILAAAGAVGLAHAAGTPSGLGPLPYNYDIQSRCEGMHVGSHVVFSGQKVVATASAGICGGPPENTFGWGADQVAGAGMHHCGENSTYCAFTAGAATNGYGLVCINGSNEQGAWQSCDYYAVVGKSVGITEGYVKNEDGSPVAGVTVDAKGKGGTSTTTGADGYYAMQVQPGSYQIVPSGGSPAGPYHPKMNTTTIAAGTSGTANFTLEDGTKLELHLDKTSVAADGIQVVNGTITTTFDGKPISTGVQLQGMPGVSPLKAVTSGPLAAVCSGTTRVWPPSTATLQDPSGTYTTVTTDTTGHYTFTITVGTTPGVWSLNAWADNTAGQISGYALAHETQSITLEKLASNPVKPQDFFTEFDKAAVYAKSLAQISASSNTIVNTLAQSNSTDSTNTGLGSLAYALVNAKDGQSVLIFPADEPPLINPNGTITARAANADDVVLDPAEWLGTGTNSLQPTLAGGQLKGLPTLAQFSSGNTIDGWKTVAGNSVTLFSSSFEFLGWGYAGVGEAGACY
jgi:hypothetical protein